jgi:hypothetical protein
VKTWWLVAAAAALAALWWLRRGKAVANGTANTSGAPAGATTAGVQAALETAARNRGMQVLMDATRQVPPIKVLLPPVGLGTVAPNLGTVPAEKPCGSPGSAAWKKCHPFDPDGLVLR